MDPLSSVDPDFDPVAAGRRLEKASWRRARVAVATGVLFERGSASIDVATTALVDRALFGDASLTSAAEAVIAEATAR
jgi:hypothetical protein